MADCKGSTSILLTISIIDIKYSNRRSLLPTKDSNPGTLLEPLKTILKSLAGTFHLRLNPLLLRLWYFRQAKLISNAIIAQLKTKLLRHFSDWRSASSFGSKSKNENAFTGSNNNGDDEFFDGFGGSSSKSSNNWEKEFEVMKLGSDRSSSKISAAATSGTSNWSNSFEDSKANERLGWFLVILNNLTAANVLQFCHNTNIYF